MSIFSWYAIRQLLCSTRRPQPACSPGVNASSGMSAGETAICRRYRRRGCSPISKMGWPGGYSPCCSWHRDSVLRKPASWWLYIPLFGAYCKSPPESYQISQDGRRCCGADCSFNGASLIGFSLVISFCFRVCLRRNSFGCTSSWQHLLGTGTAMVYPTFLAAIGDLTHPVDRAESVGVFRLWRDGGLMRWGLFFAGVIADRAGLELTVLFTGGFGAVFGSVVVGAVSGVVLIAWIFCYEQVKNFPSLPAFCNQ